MPKTDRGLDYWEREIPELAPARIAERLEALREALQLTPAEMARRIGISPSQYHNWLPGTRQDGSPKEPSRLKLHHAVAIAERCNVTVDYIGRGELYGIEEPFQSELKSRLRAVRKSNSPRRKA
jgi:transcriptional regulator with XRE-family HTH domain